MTLIILTLLTIILLTITVKFIIQYTDTAGHVTEITDN